MTDEPGKVAALRGRLPTLDSIQALRGLSALAVVAYHAFQYPRAGFVIGAAGVDVFFVISGFVMWATSVGTEQAPATFLRRRAVRVVPLYWIVTVVIAIQGVIATYPPPLSHVLMSLGFIPHISPRGDPFPLLPAGWTLNYEAIFYLVFAGVLFLPRPNRLLALSAALGAIPLVGVMFPAAYPVIANALFLEFVVGVWLAEAWRQGWAPGWKVGLALIAIGLAVFTGEEVSGWYVPLARPLTIGAPAGCIVAGSLALERAGVFPKWRLLRRMGDASYAIYLIHTPVMDLLTPVVPVWRAWLFIPLAMSVGLAAGWAGHFALERPLLRLFRARSPAREG